MDISRVLKRPYLGDLKPFSYLYSPTNIFTQGLQSTIVSLIPVIEEHNKFIKKREEKEISQDDEFDWEAYLTAQFPFFKKQLFKFSTVSCIHRSLEWLSVHKLYPPRYADKLIKDVGKSFTRKLLKMSKGSACFRIVKTHMNTSAILAISSFTFDSLERFYDIFWGKDNGKYSHYYEKIEAYLTWFYKKSALSGISFAATSIGYGLGGYLSGNQTVASLGALILQSIINITGNLALGLV